MSERTPAQQRHLDLVSMGCRWRLDLDRLDADEARATAARWQRAAELLGSGTPVLDPEPETLVAKGSAYTLSRELTRAGLLRLRGRASLLHAAALADEGGRALVLVAASGGGKSTATRELGRGLGYISDETVVLLADGRIAPHPKPPSLIADPTTPGDKVEPSPDELGLRATPARPRIAALLTLERDAAVTRPVIETVGLLDQVLAMLPQTSSTWWLPGGLHRLAEAATAGGPPSRLRYAEISRCRELVTEHLASAAPAEQTWEHLPPPAGTDPAQADLDGAADTGEDLTAATRLVRAPWSDAIAVDREVLVLAEARPLRLGGAGAALWRAADRPRALAELTDLVIADLGGHPRAVEQVRAAASDLLEHGALLRD